MSKRGSQQRRPVAKPAKVATSQLTKVVKGKATDNEAPSNKDEEEGSEEEFPDIEQTKPAIKAKAPATCLAKRTKVTTSQPTKVAKGKVTGGDEEGEGVGEDKEEGEGGGAGQ